MRLLSVTLLLVFLAGLIHVPCRAVDPEKLEELGAAYEFIHVEMEIKDNKAKEKIHWRKIIANQRGDDYASVSLYKQSSTLLKKLEIKVYDNTGKEIYKRKASDMQKTQGFGSGALYNDIIGYRIRCQAPTYPYFIEYKHELEEKTLFFWRGVSVQKVIPVDKFEYDLKISRDIPFAVKADSILTASEPVTDGDYLIYHWGASDIPEYDYEHTHPLYEPPAELKFSAGKFEFEGTEFEDPSWKNVGLWYRKLAEDQYLIEPDDGLDQPADYDEFYERVRQCYNEVIDSTRYVLVSIGISGWQPASAKDTRACGYGDCKGLSTLLISKLRSRKIESYPVLILTRDNGAVAPDFPEFGFNHVITVAVFGEDTLWMDPTCRNCPLGVLPMSDEDTYCLLVTDTGGVVLKSPYDRSDRNVFCNRTQLRLGDDMHIDLTGSITFSGIPASRNRYRIGYFDRDQLNQWLKYLYTTPGEYFDITEYSFENETDISQPLIVNIKARSRKPVDKIKNSCYCRLPYMASFIYRDVTEKDRALNLYYPCRVIDSLEIFLPEGIDSVYFPESDSLGYSRGWVKLCSSREGEKFIVCQEASNDAYLLVSDDLKKFKAFQLQVQQDIPDYVKLVQAEETEQR